MNLWRIGARRLAYWFIFQLNSILKAVKKSLFFSQSGSAKETEIVALPNDFLKSPKLHRSIPSCMVGATTDELIAPFIFS